MKTILVLSILILAGGCVDLEYRPQPPGSFIRKYGDHVASPGSLPVPAPAAFGGVK